MRTHTQTWMRRGLQAALLLTALSVLGLGAWALSTSLDTDLDQVATLQTAAASGKHVDQDLFNDMVAQGQWLDAFIMAVDAGGQLLGTSFNALDGSGADVGNGKRFTRFPRADLGSGWASHTPARQTGPNATGCGACHNVPSGGGAGTVMGNNVRDPFHTADLDQFITRNTTHVFGSGAKQRLAEEMTEALHAQRDLALQQAQLADETVARPLVTKGISFGEIVAFPDGALDTSAVQGVLADLVVRPFEWKGITANVRTFVRNAAHNELGMQAVELVGAGADGDGDGVVDELSVGDITALTLFVASQPRPASLLELAALGLAELVDDEVIRIERGRAVFVQVGCTACHVPSLTLDNPLFSEPSQNPSYRDEVLPGGQELLEAGLDPERAIVFDLTRSQPANVVALEDGSVVRLGSFEQDEQGRAIVRLFSDLWHHDLGPGLSENVNEYAARDLQGAARPASSTKRGLPLSVLVEESGAQVWLTKPLWGVGSTAPYLHDGRATTLTEAILAHGGEGAEARAAFEALGVDEQRALIAFLNNLVLFRF